jgi:hypothetical protein
MNGCTRGTKEETNVPTLLLFKIACSHDFAQYEADRDG